MTASLFNDVTAKGTTATSTQSTSVATKPSQFFSLPVELRIMIYHIYIDDHPSGPYNPRRTTYEGPHLLESNIHTIGCARTYIREFLQQDARGLNRIAGPALFKIPSSEIHKAFASSPALNEHTIHITPKNISILGDWLPPLPVTSLTRICFAVNLYLPESQKLWTDKFERTFPKRFTALKHVHIYFESMATQLECTRPPPDLHTKRELMLILMKMPCVDTIVFSFGKRLGRVPRQRFALHRAQNFYRSRHCFLYTPWSSTSDNGGRSYSRWATLDEETSGHLFPGESYDPKERERDKVEYDEYIWAMFLNLDKRYEHLKGLSFKEKMARVMEQGLNQNLTYRERRLGISGGRHGP